MFGDTPLIMVRDEEALAEMVGTLSKASVIGIDTESDSFYSYQEKVCLIQISNSDTDWVVDPLAVPDLSSLRPLMSDPDIVKVLHGSDYDVVCLKRDFDFTIVNLFDTLIAAQLLGFERIGLADLIKGHFGHEIEKKYQRHDWSKRPLLPEHIDYARGDTHWLLALRELLIRKLKQAGRMRHMDEECDILARKEWQGRTIDPNGFLRVKKANQLDQDGLRVLRRVWQFREDHAKAQNRPPFKVLPDPVMLILSEKRPTTAREMDRVLPGKVALKRRYGTGLLEAIKAGIEDDLDIPKPTSRRRKQKAQPDGPKARLRGKQAERAFNLLKEWRNRKVAQNDNLTPFTVMSNGVLKAISSRRPYSIDELVEIPIVRNWQARDFGDELVQLMDKIDPR